LKAPRRAAARAPPAPAVRTVPRDGPDPLYQFWYNVHLNCS